MRLLSAQSLPSLDTLDESDVYVVAKLEPRIRPGDQEPQEMTERWPVRWDAANPVWDSCRIIGVAYVPQPKDVVILRFYDKDRYGKDDHIGTARFCVSDLPLDGSSLTVPLKLSMRAKRVSTYQRRMSKVSGAPQPPPACTVARQALSGLILE